MSILNFLHSGGNKVSLTTPASNPSSDVTFKLPQSDGSAGQVLQTDGNGNLSWYTIPTTTPGITVADQWRITSDGTMGTDTTTNFTSNWERSDTYGAAQLGSGMTESSGIFTFPSTGIYQITANQVFSRTSAANRYAHLQLRTTTDNSSYNVAATGGAGFGQDYQQNTASLSFLFDVTNTSTHKVRFSAYTNRSSIVYRGSTDANTNSYTFIRLGDT